jgi:hypothetical protein
MRMYFVGVGAPAAADRERALLAALDEPGKRPALATGQGCA